MGGQYPPVTGEVIERVHGELKLRIYIANSASLLAGCIRTILW